jgi:paraquat-inducible protein A
VLLSAILLPILLAVAAFSFGLGITLPLVSLDKLLFFTETPSLKTIIMGLWEQGETVLALIIIAFSVLLPAAKILLLHIAVYRGKKSRSLALLSVASKWSMMDVLLVALVIFSAKTSGLATASAMPGIWFYATATLASVLASIMVRK